MICREAKLRVADNCGAKIVKCFGFFRISPVGHPAIGSLLKVSLRKVDPHKSLLRDSTVKVYPAVLVSARAARRRATGYRVRFGQNRVILLGTEGRIYGTRIRGPVAQEVRPRQIGRLMAIANRVI